MVSEPAHPYHTRLSHRCHHVNWTLPLREAVLAGQPLVGGKAVRLSELMAQGFDVPNGFVVTTDAFVSHIMEAGAGALLDGEYPTPDLLARVSSHPLASELATELKRGFTDLQAGDKHFVAAVRSSAADEDGTSASFAGQHATYYYTRDEDLEVRIVDCWLSAFTLQARSYRRQMGIFSAPRMAVIVQHMIPADVSGVAFTRDPTGEYSDAVVIESCWGLGAALVDGRVSPDAYVVARDDREVRLRRIGVKRTKVVEALLDRSGSRLESVPRHLQHHPTLSDDDATRIADLAMRCEGTFGTAQDVEWAITDGRLYLLQSRPVTRVASIPTLPQGRWIAFKPVLENSDAPFSPLTVDLVRRLLSPAMRFIDGRIYLDFDRIQKWMPFATTEAQLIDALLLRSAGMPTRLSWRRLPLLLAMAIGTYLSAGIFLARTRNVPRRIFDRFRDHCAGLLEDDKLDALATLETLVVPHGIFPPIGLQVLTANVSAVRYFFLTALFERYLDRHAKELSAEDRAALLTGESEMSSREMIEDIAKLADVAAANPVIKELILANRFDELPHQLAVHPEATQFVAALEEFMSRYGHRGTREIEFAAPRWREDPTPLFAMVASALRAGRKPALDPAARRAGAEAALANHMPSRTRRAIVSYMAARIRYYAALRENTRHWHPLAFATVRAKILILERQLMVSGDLKCPDDIFYLQWNEIQGLIDGRLAWRHLEEGIRDRRIRHERRSRRHAPLAFNLDVDEGVPGRIRLVGRCASPGKASGPARIIRDPAADGALSPGDILVAPFTDPSWTPLFLNAAAVVVEMGSYLSHAGTIARELGIPCVVDVGGLLDRVEDGQMLVVDATQGSVLLMEVTAGEEAVLS